MSKSGKAFGAALLGAVAGAVAGVLFAPKSGKETRDDIKRRAEEAKQHAGEKTEQVKHAAKDGSTAQGWCSLQR